MEEMNSDPEPAYQVPSLQVTSPDRLAQWECSQAYQEYLGFILAIGDAVKGKGIRKDGNLSAEQGEGVVGRLRGLLASLRGFMERCPPHQIQQRYGNPAFREWYDIMEQEAHGLVREVLGEQGAQQAEKELTPYLLGGFGNRTRIDYGTGHEMSFVLFLCGLFKVGVLHGEDKAVVGLTIFSQYMELVRDLQSNYRMEPAGSMGVWNLDDYQFVSFIWGAAQLSEGARLKPKAIPDPEMADMMAKDNHLFACLAYIHKVKSGPFHEHSNQLWNISGVPGWPKVYSGLIKMYKAEVLAKFPVIQHTLFGSIFSLAPALQRLPELEVEATAPQACRPGIRPGLVPGMRPGVSGVRQGIPGVSPAAPCPPSAGPTVPGLTSASAAPTIPGAYSPRPEGGAPARRGEDMVRNISHGLMQHKINTDTK